MQRFASLLVTALNLGLTGPAMTLGIDPGAYAGLGGDLVHAHVFLSAADTSCHVERVTAGQIGPSPLGVQQITCIDQLCETRDLLVCPLSD